MRTVAPGLSFSMWMLRDFRIRVHFVLMAIRNIGPACGEAGAPTNGLDLGDEARAGARSETGPDDRPIDPAAAAVRSAAQLLVVGDHVAFAHEQSVTFDPSWSAPTTAARVGDDKPVTCHVGENRH